MSTQHQYAATVVWRRRAAEAFTDNRYSRAHEWSFDDGISVSASSSPSVVPLPLSSEQAVDPEEAFVAALSSCHMLFFLSHAARRGYVIDCYEDSAIGEMGLNDWGRMAMLKVRLRPCISWRSAPTPMELRELHKISHNDCYLANSVTTVVTVEGQD